MLGHYSVAFTLDTYTHITPEMKREAADKIGNFLAEAEQTEPKTLIRTDKTDGSLQAIS